MLILVGIMSRRLKFILRHLSIGRKKKNRAFYSEKQFYDFCRGLYNKSGGANPELLKAYEFYQNHFIDDRRSG